MSKNRLIGIKRSAHLRAERAVKEFAWRYVESCKSILSGEVFEQGHGRFVLTMATRVSGEGEMVMAPFPTIEDARGAADALRMKLNSSLWFILDGDEIKDHAGRHACGDDEESIHKMSVQIAAAKVGWIVFNAEGCEFTPADVPDVSVN